MRRLSNPRPARGRPAGRCRSRCACSAPGCAAPAAVTKATGIDRAVEAAAEEAMVAAVESEAVERAMARVLQGPVVEEAVHGALESDAVKQRPDRGARQRAGRRGLAAAAGQRRGAAAGRADRRGAGDARRDQRPERRPDRGRRPHDRQRRPAASTAASSGSSRQDLLPQAAAPSRPTAPARSPAASPSASTC